LIEPGAANRKPTYRSSNLHRSSKLRSTIGV
jgi:hypothetical protein